MIQILHKYGEIEPAKESWVDDLDPAERNNVVCAIFIILYTNYITTTRILDTYDQLKKNKEFCNKRLKSTADAFTGIVKNMDMVIQKKFMTMFPKDFMEGFVDMCDTVDERLDPNFKALESSLMDIFHKEYNLTNYKEFTQIYYMDLLIGIAQRTIMDLVEALPSLKKGKMKLLDKQRAYDKSTLMCRFANERLVDNVNINLPKQLTLMSKRKTILNKLRDADIFSEAFVAGGWKLPDESPENIPGGPGKTRTA